jgi:hypothetical protein
MCARARVVNGLHSYEVQHGTAITVPVMRDSAHAGHARAQVRIAQLELLHGEVGHSRPFHSAPFRRVPLWLGSTEYRNAQ